MTTNNLHLTREYEEDITAATYGADPIPANSVVLLDTANGMTPDNPRGVRLATAGGPNAGPWGVTVETLHAKLNGITRPGRVAVAGGINVRADGVVAIGDELEASDDALKLGRVRKLTSGKGMGKAETPGVDGEFVFVRLRSGA